jgi:hypothetical protein
LDRILRVEWGWNIWRGVCIAGVALLVISRPLAAQDPGNSPAIKVELTPMLGYRTNMSLTTEPGVDGVTSEIVFRDSPAYGVAVGFRSHDIDVVEFRWSRQDTRMLSVGPIALPPSQRVTINQFHMDCSHEYVVDEWPAWVRPYIMASVGATHISGAESLGSLTRFSFGIGTGIKFFPTRQVGFKVQAEWLPIWITHQTRAFCSGGCIIRFSGQVISQGEVTMGPVFRF